jgi:hypothetical protein
MEAFMAKFLAINEGATRLPDKLIIKRAARIERTMDACEA